MDKPTSTKLSKKDFIAFCTLAHEQCVKVNPSNPLAVADQIEAAFKAIELWNQHQQGTRGHFCSICATALSNVLAAIKEALLVKG